MLNIIKQNRFVFINIYLLMVLIIVLMTSELLSFFNQLNMINVRTFSFLIFVASLVLLVYNLKNLSRFIIENIYFSTILIIVMLLTAIPGVLISPNLWDSMTYHLPRFLHWGQNKNLQYFSTSIYRQNESPILPDLIYMWIYSLFNSDNLIFLLPWLSIIFSSVLVYKISYHISQNRSVAQLSGILSVFLPNQIGFMSSSHTDPLTTYLVLLMLFVVITRSTRPQSINYQVYIGLIPILLTAKTTAVIFTIPLYLLVLYRDKPYIRRNIFRIFSLTLISITLAIPSLYRLLNNFAEPGVSGRENSISAVFMTDITVNKIFYNFIYIVASLIQSPIKIYNEKIEQTLIKFQPNNINFSREFDLNENLHADFAAPIVITILLMISLFSRRQFKQYSKIYLLMFIQLILLSAVVEWQPWINRFTSTVIMIGIIPLGFFVYKLRYKIRILVLSSIILYSSFWLFFNPTRTLLDPMFLQPIAINLGINADDLLKMRHDLIYEREDQYFSAKPELANSYFAAVDIIKKEDPEIISLYIGDDDFEYPLWALTGFKINITHGTDKGNIQDKEIIFCTNKCNEFTHRLIYSDNYIVLYSKYEN